MFAGAADGGSDDEYLAVVTGCLAHGQTYRLTRTITSIMEAKPGRQLVIVRYRPDHFWGYSWINNGYDIPTQHVIWARDTEPRRIESAAAVRVQRSPGVVARFRRKRGSCRRRTGLLPGILLQPNSSCSPILLPRFGLRRLLEDADFRRGRGRGAVPDSWRWCHFRSGSTGLLRCFRLHRWWSRQRHSIGPDPHSCCCGNTRRR